MLKSAKGHKWVVGNLYCKNQNKKNLLIKKIRTISKGAIFS